EFAQQAHVDFWIDVLIEPFSAATAPVEDLVLEFLGLWRMTVTDARAVDLHGNLLLVVDDLALARHAVDLGVEDHANACEIGVPSLSTRNGVTRCSFLFFTLKWAMPLLLVSNN